MWAVYVETTNEEQYDFDPIATFEKFEDAEIFKNKAQEYCRYGEKFSVRTYTNLPHNITFEEFKRLRNLGLASEIYIERPALPEYHSNSRKI